ncbi:SGNH/GDSL hydrolase family protein [Flavobacterium sp. W21_SRS_FM6]|uniref:SGNH/GDSL hydrolase family protein n=1 Tax=Flavobacterium sp. W21_SRS_FM6 TaxID=3240268 RepID=UPI003F932BE7
MTHKRINKLTVFFCVFTLLNLVVISFLVNTLVKNSLYTHLSRLDPINLRFYEQANTMLSFNPDVVLIGDSRIEQWDVSTLGYNVDDIVNRGISGQTSEQIVYRIKQDLIDLKPRLAVIQFGINDLKLLAFAPKRDKDIIQQLKNNYQKIVSEIESANIQVIVTTIILPSIYLDEWYFYDLSATVKATNTLNAFILKDLKCNCKRVDFASLLSSDGEYTHARFAADTLHINEFGYSILASNLTKHIFSTN